ncbi:MAG: hypothetical protein WCA22_18955, partial [Candidatus Binatus sp.]
MLNLLEVSGIAMQLTNTLNRLRRGVSWRKPRMQQAKVNQRPDATNLPPGYLVMSRASLNLTAAAAVRIPTQPP